MSDLPVQLDTIDFKELVELGRSLIPTLAPGWTDHNVHDPGIMLMELMAWIADAQVYTLARSSRGEREAYGHLLGLALTGPRPAHGLIWPIGADSPATTRPPWAAGTVVDRVARVTGDRPQAPAFYTTRRIELTTAALTRIATRFADGSTRDWTRASSQQGATFLPFGESPQKGDRLQLTLTGTLIGAPATGAPIAIGVETVPDAPRAASASAAATGADDSPNGTLAACALVDLRVSLSDGTAPWVVSIEDDTTAGLSRSGVLLLTVDPALAGHSGTFTLTIESANGFLLPPRVQRIALDVLPVEQVEPVVEENPSFGTGMPDQTYTLTRAGLMYPLDAGSFTVLVASGGATAEPWTRTRDFSGADPDAPVYAIDEGRGVVTFGNGINGRRPPPGATLRVEYPVTAGARGNLPRNLAWTVSGVPSPFGVNSAPTSGGADPRDLARLRAVARSRVHGVRPIVTTADLEGAALACADLAVRRAREIVPGASPRRVSGARVLVAVGPHDSQPEPDTFQESAIWLAEIRRRLTPRLPLGQSLAVIPPRLLDVHVVAHLTAAPQLDPKALEASVAETLRAKLAITSPDGAPVWPFGRDITVLSVKGWLRNVEGVARVVDVTLRTPVSPGDTDRVELGATGLPRLVIDAGDITIDRPMIGGRA